MGLMDKFKNLFTDEEIIDEEEIEEPVKIKEIKKEEPKKEENKLPTFMREKIEKEEKQKEEKNDFVPDFSIGKELENVSQETKTRSSKNEEIGSINSKSNNDFKFPIAFEESDFTEISRVSRQAMKSKPIANSSLREVKEVPKKQVSKKETKVSELYKDKKKEKEIEKKFKATPIISPIYGVLDKNYRTEELEPIKGDNYELQRPSKNIDFDSVRKKAYGSLTEEIKENLMCENCEYLKKAKACKKEIDEDNLMFEALCEKKNKKVDLSLDDVTLDEATENYFDYGFEYKKKEINNEELDDVRIVNHTENDGKKINNNVPPVKSSINLLSTLKKSMGDNENDNTINESGFKKEEKNLELTDDLFSLIDSMYDEGKD